MNNTVKDKIISSLFWKINSNLSFQVIQFIIQVILARLLLPTDYGVLAIVVVFIHISNALIQSGFSSSLIQKKVLDQIDYSTVFFISLFIALILYLLLFFSSPMIGDFYGNERLISMIRVLALVIFPGAIHSIQIAYISRNMKFEVQFYASLGSSTISGFFGILLAFYGYGPWALIFQQLINQVCLITFFWFLIPWRPSFQFSISRAKILFSFGWKLLVSSIIETIFQDVRTLIIGKIYSNNILGYYRRGQQFPQLIIGVLLGAIQSIMFPALSAQQDYAERVKAMVRRSIITSSFIVFPLMVGLAVVAEPMVLFLLTDKWLPAVPFLQIFCASFAFWPIHTANLQAINAMGRSDIFLKLEIVKKIIGLFILGISIPLGIYAMALGEVLSSIISSFLNAYPNKKLLQYGYGEQIKDILPSLFLSLVMGVIVYLFLFLGLSPLLTMCIQVIVGAIIYVGLAYLFKLECFTYLVQTVLSLLKSKRNSHVK